MDVILVCKSLVRMPLTRRRNGDSEAGGSCPAPPHGERTLAGGSASRPNSGVISLRAELSEPCRRDGVGGKAPGTLAAPHPLGPSRPHSWASWGSRTPPRMDRVPPWLGGVGCGRVGALCFSPETQREGAVGQGREACVLWSPRGEPC